MPDANDQPTYSVPSFAWLGLEPMRAAIEYASMRWMNRAKLPSGDGHPVIVFPGLTGGGQSIAPLVSCCADLGYATHDWGRGCNFGPPGDCAAWIETLADEANAVFRQHGRPMSLIGWSLGGIYAREIAKLLGARRVRQVVTICTPFAAAAADVHLGWLHRMLNNRSAESTAALVTRLRTLPPVPCSSIYSRSDGVVAWQACREAQTHPSRACENIEIEGSHTGMGWNPRVLAIVADRLAQPVAGWRPYAGPASSRH